MNNCCKNNENHVTIKGSQDYNEDGRIIEYKIECKVCGEIEKWICIDDKENKWENER